MFKSPRQRKFQCATTASTISTDGGTSPPFPPAESVGDGESDWSWTDGRTHCGQRSDHGRVAVEVARVALSQGRRGEALALARAAREIAEETGPGFVGPLIHGLLALVEDTREGRGAALAAGEALLEKGAVGHNHFWFRRYAIERALLDEDWGEAERQRQA